MKDFEQFLNEFKVKSKKTWRVFDGNLMLHGKGKEIPEEYQYDEVNGNFGCVGNNLTTLKGCPSIVHGFFNCMNNKLTSLEYAPKEVDGLFNCEYNKVKFTEEQVRSVCDIKGKVYV